MLRRIVPYCFSLCILAAACAVYQATFVSWIEPEPLPKILMAASPVLRTDDTLASMFPAESWQRGNCMRLLTRDGVLLFENLKQISDDQWKLWPVTVVIGPQGNSPLILEAVEGAEIKFTEPLDVMSGGAPPIEVGRMIGNVRIENFEHQADASDFAKAKAKPSRRIVIEASEVGIDHRKVWTTQPIRMQLGDIRISGRDLTLHLATGSGIVAAGANAISILDRLELIYLDEVSVPLPHGGLWGNVKPPRKKPNIAPGRPIPLAKPSEMVPEDDTPGLATLQCGGRVVFQFATGELTLQDRVELRHQASLANKQTDTFVCEQMRLKFADVLTQRQRSDKPQDLLISLLAIGRPARASLPGFEADLAAGQIELDTRANMVRMGGPAGVLVSYAGNRWQFGQVNYLINSDDPKQLGTFDAVGPGGMDVAANLDVPVKRLQWSGGVKLEKLQDSNQISLRVDGDVRGSTVDGGSFRSESARLFLQELEEPSDAPDNSEKLVKTRLVPRQFQASGGVKFETPMISVATKLLQLYFEVDSSESPAPATATVPTVGVAQSPSPLRGWVKQPGEQIGPTKFAGNAKPVPRSRPSVQGDTINAKLRLSGGDVTAQDLTVVGNVALRHEIETKSGPLPAVLTGDRLLLSDGGGNDVLQIGSGVNSPARFDLGDGFFVGPLIQVRMADNVVWIKDAGEFRLPTQVLPRVGSIASQSAIPIEPSVAPLSAMGAGNPQASTSNIQWLNAPTCRWKGQMIFDGQIATLTDGIEIHATIMSGEQRDVWDLHLTGDQLQMRLDQGVRVREVESVKAATVDQVVITSSLSHPLLVTANQLTGEGLRKARHVIAAPQLTIQPATGSLVGAGPGWYRVWTQSDPISQFSPASDSTQSSMFGMHLAYEQTLSADLKSQSLEFNGGVRIAGRQVATWDDVIDVAKIQGLRLGESTLDCDRLRLSLDTSRPFAPASASWELETIGNVVFQTRIERGLFNGTADRATYSAIKDIFLIEGSPGRSAVLNQTLPTGQPGISVSGKRMTANPKTMELQNSELDRLQMGTLPAAISR